LTPSAGTQFQEEPLQRGCKMHGGGEKIVRFSTEIIINIIIGMSAIAEFLVHHHSLSRKRYEIGPWLLRNVNYHRRSIEWWHFQWPWWTLNPVFKVTAFLKSNISKTAHL